MYKVGDVFEYKDIKLKVEESYECTDCYFNTRSCDDFPCASVEREDRKEVIFVEVKEEKPITQMYAGCMGSKIYYEIEFPEGWAKYTYSKVDMESNSGDELRIELRSGLKITFDINNNDSIEDINGLLRGMNLSLELIDYIPKVGKFEVGEKVRCNSYDGTERVGEIAGIRVGSIYPIVVTYVKDGEKFGLNYCQDGRLAQSDKYKLERIK